MTEPDGPNLGGSQTSLRTFHRERSTTQRSEQRSSTEQTSPVDVTTHVGDLAPLLEVGEHTPTSTNLVIAPVALHRRAIKQRFVSAERPRDSLALVRPETVAYDLLGSTNESPPEIVDRVDRLDLLTTVLETRPILARRYQRVLGCRPAASVRDVEHARTVIETTTGYHPERIRSIRNHCRRTGEPASTDLREFLEATVETEATLRRLADGVTSTGAVLRSACRELSENETAAWETTYPTIERVWLCGLSTVSASLMDLLVAIHRTTDVEITLLLRRASASILRRRLSDILAVETPGTEVF